MKISDFKSNPTAEIEGVVFNFDDTTYIRVAKGNNKKFLAEVRNKGKLLRRQYRRNIPDEKTEELVKMAFARHILLEMVGFVDDHGDIVGKGEKIEDTFANRLKMCQAPAYAEFMDFVSDLAGDKDFFRDDDEETDELGKSPKASSGNSPGVKKKTGSKAHK